MPTYSYDLIGYSYSGGQITPSGTPSFYQRYYEEIKGGSDSLGNVIYGRMISEPLSGYSTTAGLVNTDRLHLVTGYSTSNGRCDTDYLQLLSGYSTSNSRCDTNYLCIIYGYSSSNGQISYRLINIVVDWLGCYVINLDTMRTYEFTNYDFLGFGKFNNILIGVKNTSINDLETSADQDITTDINMETKYGMLDFGLPNKKAIRNIYVEGEGNQVKLTLTTYTGQTQSFVMSLNQFRNLPRTIVDKYIEIKLENVNGEQIRITKVFGKVDFLEMKGEIK